MSDLRIAALTLFLLFGLSVAADAGTITKVTASPAVVVTGQAVLFTEEGTNPCGASNMNYGDGIVITYAIPELPAKQTHAFEKPGMYTVIARGMGNCDGEATTTVRVNPAAAPPPPTSPGTSHYVSRIRSAAGRDSTAGDVCRQWTGTMPVYRAIW